MALTRAQKAEQVVELTDALKKAKSVMFAHYIGLSVGSVSKLRSSLRKEKAQLKVAKKTLIRIAAKEVGAPEIPEDGLPGPVACIFSFEDPVSGASAAFKFAKDHEQVKLIGGIFDGKLLSAKEATEFARIPGRQVLLATFMAMVSSPLTKFASAIGSPLTGFARALSELAKKAPPPPAAEAPQAAAPSAPAPSAEPAPAAPAAAPSEPAAPSTPGAPAA